jgi:hypothetical protein
VIDRLISAVKKLTKGVKKMSEKTVSIPVSAFDNGATLAMSLYSQGVDITAKHIVQTFSKNFPFVACVNIAKNNVATNRADVLKAMQHEERKSLIWSEAYNQSRDSGKGKAESVQIANNAVEGIAYDDDESPTRKTSPKSVNPLPAANQNVAKANPGLVEKLLFQFESAKYRVGKNMLNGDYRVTLTNKNTVNRLGKLEGQTVNILPYGEFLVSKAGDSWANLRPVNQPKAESPKAESPKADSDITSRVDKLESMLAKILAAVE